MPTRLSDVSIDDKNLRIMAEKCCANGPDGNFKKLTADDVYEIYKLAL